MAQCHQASITIMKELLDEIDYLDKGRAMEVAAGDGQVTQDLLKDRFDFFDCFDQCPKAVKILEKLRMTVPELDLVDQSRMQSYVWQQKYAGIFVRWCIGYLGDDELVKFLRAAQNSLERNQERVSRQRTRGSFIFVLDNLLADQEGPKKE